MALPTASEIASLYLFGSRTPPENLLDETLGYTRETSGVFLTSRNDYFDPVTGPGRFAIPGNFEVVSGFFDQKNVFLDLADDGQLDDHFDPVTNSFSLPKLKVAQILGISNFFGLTIGNRLIADDYDDYGVRTFIWGGTSFKIGDDTEFVIGSDDDFSIQNLTVVAQRNPDDFDFVGSDGVTNIGGVALEQFIDPSHIGKRVDLPITEGGATEPRTYTEVDLAADLITMGGWSSVNRLTLKLNMQNVLDDLHSSGTVDLTISGKAVLYGTEFDDTITDTFAVSGFDISRSLSAFENGWINFYLDEYYSDGVIYLGGNGNDNLTGTSAGSGRDWLFGGNDSDFATGLHGSDLIFGGDGTDVLFGGDADDFISGGIGFDQIFGGDGFDTLTYGDVGVGTLETSPKLINFKTNDFGEDTVVGIEAVIGTAGVDIFIGSDEGGEYIAGGGGIDLLTIPIKKTADAPTVFWGGAGNDIVTFKATGYGDSSGEFGTYAPGILVVEVDGLTEANFSEFRLDDVSGLSGDLLANVDLIVINPEQGDRFFIENDAPMSSSYGSILPISSSSSSWALLPPAQPDAPCPELPEPQYRAGFYDVSFLSGGESVYAIGEQRVYDLNIETEPGPNSTPEAPTFVVVSCSISDEGWQEMSPFGDPNLFNNGLAGWYIVGGAMNGRSLNATSDAFSLDMTGVVSPLSQVLEPLDTIDDEPNDGNSGSNPNGGGDAGPNPNGGGDQGFLDGTNSSETIDVTYLDPNGENINDTSQVIVARGGDDNIYDGAGDDVVFGGAGFDRFYAGAGADTYDGGGDQRDNVLYIHSDIGLTIDMNDASNSTGIAAGDTFTSIERVHATNYDDIIYLAAGVDMYDARNGDDIIHDAGGYELMKGGNGADTFVLIAGDGHEDRIHDFEIGVDTIDISGWGITNWSQLDIALSTNAGGAFIGGVTASYGDESVRFSYLGADDIPLFTASDFGLIEDDNITSTGDGTLSGTSGNDTINVGFADLDGDTLIETGQRIESGDGFDNIYDGAGDDVVIGGSGIDRFWAGLGADTYDGAGDHRDEVRYQRSDIGLTINMNDTSLSTGAAQGDSYINIERIQGTNFDDIIYLADGVDAYNALNGNDVIYDANGFEFMQGGNGRDTFVFVAGDGQRDRIHDFNAADDWIDISAWGANSVNDLVFTEHTNAQGSLIVSFGIEEVMINNLTLTDVSSLTDDQFIFA